MVLRHDLVSVLPSLRKKYLKYANYKEQTMEDIFSADQLKEATKLSAYTMQTSVVMNNRNGTFSIKGLPMEAQISPMHGIAVGDFDKDGKVDILMGGNFYQSKPEAGIYDASFGILLRGDGTGNFKAVPADQSGFFSVGAIRDMKLLKCLKRKMILVAKNNNHVQLVQYK